MFGGEGKRRGVKGRWWYISVILEGGVESAWYLLFGDIGCRVRPDLTECLATY